MRFVKASIKLPPHDKDVHIEVYGKIGYGRYLENRTPKIFWYQTYAEIATLTEDLFDRIQWLDKDEQDEGWVPVESGVLPKANQKCFLYNGGLFLNFFKFWPKGFNGNDEPVFVDMNDKGPYSLDEITHWRLANIAHPDLPPATT